jgi:hypothetical protein
MGGNCCFTSKIGRVEAKKDAKEPAITSKYALVLLLTTLPTKRNSERDLTKLHADGTKPVIATRYLQPCVVMIMKTIVVVRL